MDDEGMMNERQKLLEAAAGTTDPFEADAILCRLTALNMRKGHGREDAAGLARDSIAYFAGYYDDETRARVERLFRCAHPFFGAIAENGPPTPAEAFEMGRQYMADLRSPEALEGGARFLTELLAKRRAEP